jgi:hypothetical protein
MFSLHYNNIKLTSINYLPKFSILISTKYLGRYSSSGLGHWRIILIVIAGRMMKLETLPEVQLVLLYSEVNGVNLLLYGRDGLLHGCHRKLHGAHAPLNSSQCLHDLRIADFRLGWRDSLRRGSHTRYAYRNRRRGHIIVIRIISPQLSI